MALRVEEALEGEAAGRPANLLIGGEAETGKTALLTYLLLRVATRDAEFSSWARKRLPSGLASFISELARRLRTLYTISAGMHLIRASLVIWAVGAVFAHSKLFAILALPVFYSTFNILWLRNGRSGMQRCVAIDVALVAIAASDRLVPFWAYTAVGIALFALLYPYLVHAPAAMLERFARTLTRYPLPYMLRATSLVGDISLQEHIVNDLSRRGVPRRTARDWLTKGAMIVLVDDLHHAVEMGIHLMVRDSIRSFARDCHRVTIVAASQKSDWPDYDCAFVNFDKFVLQDLCDAEASELVNRVFKIHSRATADARGESLIAVLGRSVRTPTRPGLLLKLCASAAQEMRLTTRRVSVFDRSVAGMCAAVDEQLGRASTGDRNDTALHCQAVATHFKRHNTTVISLAQLTRACRKPALHETEAQVDTAAWIREGVRSGLARQSDKTTLEFSDIGVQDLLTARELHRCNKAEFLVSRIFDPSWRDVIAFYCGLEADASGMLNLLADGDPILAGVALSESRGISTSALAPVAARIVAGLKDAVQRNPHVRQSAADTLAAIQHPEAQRFVEQCARHPNSNEVMLAAFLALDKAGCSRELAQLSARLGPVLRLLTTALPTSNRQQASRILRLLDRLKFHLVSVPAGEFIMGDATVPAERPVHSVTLPQYWIGKYPVTNELFDRFAKETEYSAQGGWPVDFRRGRSRHPAVWLTADDAREFCSWSGTTLPTEAEWEKAARGTDGRRFPWGNNWSHVRCNIQGFSTTSIDEHDRWTSPYGCVDVLGNVHEWTRSLFKPYPYVDSDGREALETGFRPGRHVVRGGSWYNEAATCRVAVRVPTPIDRANRIGFRVAVGSSTSLQRPMLASLF